MTAAPYLTVAEVADELGMSTSGVYKLIRREKLGAFRLSERKLIVSRIALDAYRRRLKHGPPPPPPLPEARVSLEVLIQEFRDATGSEPDQWIEAFSADRIEDTAENMRTYIQALGILAVQQERATSEVAAVTASAR